jgi:hypothetical protein
MVHFGTKKLDEKAGSADFAVHEEAIATATATAEPAAH